MTAPMSCIHEGALRQTAALARETPPGAFVEVGVYKGGCAWYLAQVAEEQGRELHLFDTFSGIPFQGDGDQHKPGDFGDTSLAEVQAAVPGAHFHVGIFPTTMPAEFPPVAFVHCDVDQVDSVRAVILHLWPRIVPGGIMAFDDMNQPAAKALIEQTFGSNLHLSFGVWYARKDA